MERNGYFVVKVGKKKIWSYVTACVTCFNRGGEKLIIRARGANIPNAIEVANSLKKTFYSDLRIENVSLVEDKVTDNENEMSVMAIEILVSRGRESRLSTLKEDQGDYAQGYEEYRKP